MSYFMEQLLNGICQGFIYALFGIGYSLIVGVVGLVSFTFGEVIMIGAFSAYFCSTFITGNILVNLLLSFVMSSILGIAIHKICYERFFDAPRYITVVCTIGMSMLVRNLAQIFFGSETKAMPALFGNGGIDLGIVRVTYVQLFIMGTVIALCVALSLFLGRTKQGVMLRAVSQDKKAAAMMGVHVGRATLLGNIIGCGIGGVAGMLYAVYYSSLSPTMGSAINIKAFSAAVLGGLTDVVSAAVGGMSIGVLENLGIALFSSSMRHVIAFIFLIVVLLFRPKGIHFKRRSR